MAKKTSSITTHTDISEVVANCDRLSTLRFSPTMPFAFSEQGVAMLASVLHSPSAVQISIKIIEAFVAMRHFLLSNAQVFQRLDRMELKQLETDHKIEQCPDKLGWNKEKKRIQPIKGISDARACYPRYSEGDSPRYRWT